MVLVIDNYDSFTYNLVQLIAGLGAEPVVRMNDEITVQEVREMAPSHIVISPGPCSPAEAGISVAVIERLGSRIPILGVCLGHQAIAAAHGARIVRAQRPVHGKVAPVRHDGTGVFAGLPTPLHVTRYHSLIVEPASLPDSLVACAWSEGDDEIQGLRHATHPLWGVQFHPESIASEGGQQLISNFLGS
jgi:anthranilate synthase/aminodeoxychorismate synthase-like glutamine amidotransferase